MTNLMPYAAGEPSLGGGLGDQVYSRLLGERIIFLGQQVDDDIANKITAQLLLLAAAEPDKDIYLYINSPGGSVTAGMAVYDTMQYIPNDVVTIGMGMAASMGQFLLTGGTAGKRFALPNTDILMHQGSAGIGGTASDIKIQAEYLLRTKKRMAEITARHSGQTVETIIRDGDRDRWYTAEEAKEYGLIDEIITCRFGRSGRRRHRGLTDPGPRRVSRQPTERHQDGEHRHMNNIPAPQRPVHRPAGRQPLRRSRASSSAPRRACVSTTRTRSSSRSA